MRARALSAAVRAAAVCAVALVHHNVIYATQRDAHGLLQLIGSQAHRLHEICQIPAMLLSQPPGPVRHSANQPRIRSYTRPECSRPTWLVPVAVH